MNILNKLDRSLAANWPALWISQLHRCIIPFLIICAIELILACILPLNISSESVLLIQGIFFFLNLIYWQTQINLAFEINLSLKKVCLLYPLILLGILFSYILMLIIPFVLEKRTQKVLANYDLCNTLNLIRFKNINDDQIQKIRAYLVYPDTYIQVRQSGLEDNKFIMTSFLSDLGTEEDHSTPLPCHNGGLILFNSYSNSDSILSYAILATKTAAARSVPIDKIIIDSTNSYNTQGLKQLLSLTQERLDSIGKVLPDLLRNFGAFDYYKLYDFNYIDNFFTNFIKNTDGLRMYLTTSSDDFSIALFLFSLLIYIPTICLSILLSQKYKLKILKLPVPVIIYSFIVHIGLLILLFALTFDIFSDDAPFLIGYFSIWLFLLIIAFICWKRSSNKIYKVLALQTLHFHMVLFALFIITVFNYFKIIPTSHNYDLLINMLSTFILMIPINIIFFRLYHRLQYMPAKN
ncbi:MAG: hypothetical protein QM731_12580 [Chitinophagaceae bacterium]